jgi:uncharacterized membrane protein
VNRITMPTITLILEQLRRHTPFVVASGFGLLLIAGRRVYIGGNGFGFLLWNLFLAWLPLAFAVLTLNYASSASRPQTKMWLAGIAWLLFFPNAPYLVTDLIHWKKTGAPRAWFDLMILAHFAGLGVWLGYESLRMLHRHIAGALGTLAGWTFAILSLMLAGFGVYLGRFLRWNSWDVLTSPADLAGDVAKHVLQPMEREHAQAWAFSLVFGGVLFFGYWLTSHNSEASRRNIDPATNSGPTSPAV